MTWVTYTFGRHSRIQSTVADPTSDTTVDLRSDMTTLHSESVPELHDSDTTYYIRTRPHYIRTRPTTFRQDHHSDKTTLHSESVPELHDSDTTYYIRTRPHYIRTRPTTFRQDLRPHYIW